MIHAPPPSAPHRCGPDRLPPYPEGSRTRTRKTEETLARSPKNVRSKIIENRQEKFLLGISGAPPRDRIVAQDRMIPRLLENIQQRKQEQKHHHRRRRHRRRQQQQQQLVLINHMIRLPRISRNDHTVSREKKDLHGEEAADPEPPRKLRESGAPRTDETPRPTEGTIFEQMSCSSSPKHRR